MHPFLEATAWAEAPGEPKRGIIDAAWYQGRGAYGGLVAALLLKACASHIRDPARIPRSLTVHFAAAAEAGPLELHSALEREGTRVSHTTARMLRDGRVVAFASATFALPRAHAMSYQLAPPPEVPPLEETLPTPPHPLMPAFTSFFDMRFCVGGLPFSRSPEPLLGGYVAFKEPLICDAAGAVALLDVWPPAAMAMAEAPMLAASVDFTVHLFHPLPLPGAQPGDHYLSRVRSRFAKDGYTEELRELWSKDGLYVGQCRQLMALF